MRAPITRSRAQWRCSATTFLLLYCILNSALFQGPLYVRAFQTLGNADLVALLCVATLFVLQFSASLALLTITALISVRLTQWLCVTLVLGSSVALYFIVVYGVVLDQTMMGNVLSTRAEEAKQLLHPKLAAFVLLLGVVPGLLISRVKITRSSRQKLLAFGFATLVAGVSWLYANAGTWLWLDKNAKVLGGLILPWSYVVNSVRFYADTVQLRPPALLPPPVVVDAGRVVVVLVIGEAARAQNFSLYGYSRDTNPLLARERVVAMPSTHSCSTYTTQSLRCMLSRKGEHTGARVTEEILPNYLQRNGIEVIWRSNNWGEPGLRVGSRLSAEQLRQRCHGSDCQRLNYDEALLFDLGSQIRDAARAKVFVVLHQAGSHGPEYFRKYPPEFEVFRPVCMTVDEDKCTHEELVNAYDNSILYTDFVLSRVIDVLQSLGDVPAVMLYVSDHGESLGEYGLYLHGTPSEIAPEFQTQVPFIVWMSDSFAQRRHLEGKRLDVLSAYSQSYVFHSVMGALGLRSGVYDKTLDLFARRGDE